MSRIASSPVATAIDAEHCTYAVFVDLAFASGTFRAFSGVGTINFNGSSYTGVGQFGGMSSLNERGGQRDFSPVRLALSGVPSVLLAGKVPDRDDWFNKTASIYFVPFDEATNEPITPIEPAIFEGFMDQLKCKRAGTTFDVEVIVRHHLADWDESIDFYYTHEHQALIDASDLGLNQVHEVETKEVVWGGQRIGGPRGNVWDVTDNTKIRDKF